jgi:hypothetical protein
MRQSSTIAITLLVLLGLVHPAAADPDLTTGAWAIENSVDVQGHEFGGSLIFTSQRAVGSAYAIQGYFDWIVTRNGVGYGRVLFSGTVTANGAITVVCDRLDTSVPLLGIGCGATYRAQVTGDGARIVNGTFTGGNNLIPGVFEARRVAAGLLPPGNFTADVTGLSVTLTWTASAGATSYVLEAGSAPGLVDRYSGDIGPVTRLVAGAPAGIYYLRLRARGPAGLSAPSSELQVSLGTTCSAPPAPAGLTATVAGGVVNLRWDAVPGATGYVLEAGTSPSDSNVFNGAVGAITSLAGVVPPNTYFVRVRSTSGCGIGAPGATIAVIVP